MADFTVSQHGVDPFGRPVLMTAFLHEWWEAYVDALGFRPRILQGCFMSRVPGGGAAASSGAHDEAGCIDVETEGLTAAEIDRMVWLARTFGGAAYRRDMTAQHGGMPQHMHITVGADRPLSDMAQALWSSYVSGGDGLAGADGRPSGAPDYERRPNPLVLIPPEEMFMLNDADKQWIANQIKAAVTTAVAANKLDVGKPAKWSDDTVAKTLLTSVAKIAAGVEQLLERKN